MAFACSALTARDVKGRHVIEAGALDVNGSVRPHVESLGPRHYLSTDMRGGPGVDLVCAAEELPSMLGTLGEGAPLSGGAGVVIGMEMLEHCRDWKAALSGLIEILQPGGILVLTTRSEGFPYHAHPEDHWRFPVEAMGRALRAAGLDVERLEADPDPASPGVFAVARKPEGWSWPDVARAWGRAGVTAVVP
jgi:SAM-dependent methyltransferase